MEILREIIIVRYRLNEQGEPRYHIAEADGGETIVDHTELCLREALHPEAKTYWRGSTLENYTRN